MAVTADKLFASDIAHLVSTTVGSQFRIDFLFTQRRPRDRWADVAWQADEALRNATRFLELSLVAVCAIEALAETGAESLEVSGKDRTFFTRRVGELTGLDPTTVVKEAEAAGLLQSLPSSQQRMPPLSEVVRAARTVIESCPISDLEDVANMRSLAALGHRCRVAYEGLRAFILRQDPSARARLGIVGREYTRGALSLDEVAALLQSDPVDAVALLEEYGYARPIDTILLTEDERRARFARVREDRLSRGGRFQPTPEQVARDVVASERIEGVDARLWIRPKVD